MKKFYSILAMLLMVTFLAGCGKKEEPKPAEKTEAPKEQGVSGETFTNEQAKVSVNLPEGWYYEADENNIIASPEGGGFEVHFETLQADQADAALAQVVDVLNNDFKNVVMGDPIDLDIDGMKGAYFKGTADGLKIAVGLVDTPVPGTMLYIGAWGDPSVIEKYDKEINYIFNNVKALK